MMSIRLAPQALRVGAEFSPLATAPVSASPAAIPSKETPDPWEGASGHSTRERNVVQDHVAEVQRLKSRARQRHLHPQTGRLSLLKGLPDLQLWVYYFFLLNPKSTHSHFQG